jgi:hypothetical protein
MQEHLVPIAEAGLSLTQPFAVMKQLKVQATTPKPYKLAGC